MTEESLKKANNYKQQIDELNKFVKDCKNCWYILRLHNKRFKLKTAYGSISNELEVSRELAERILKTIDDYIFSLEYKLENM
jgi:hypothetical protein